VSGNIEVYAFEDADGAPQTWTTQDPAEAEAHARRHGYRVIAHTYAWEDSEVVWDFTGATDPVPSRVDYRVEGRIYPYVFPDGVSAKVYDVWRYEAAANGRPTRDQPVTGYQIGYVYRSTSRTGVWLARDLQGHLVVTAADITADTRGGAVDLLGERTEGKA
jgi:hypothetical protein